MLDTDDVALVTRYRDAADRYFREIERPEELFDKPFVPLPFAPYALSRLAVLVAHLRLGPNLVVLDFGAGMCWLSGVLSRMGCVPVALDVSATALRLGRSALERLPAGRWKPPVTYSVFDGFSFDLPDESVDRVACFDALHHVANKSRVLSEMLRVLKSGGRVCLVEPGPGHAASASSLRESRMYGVLEDEVDAGKTCELALRLGFSQASLVPLVEPGGVEWPAGPQPGDPPRQATFPVRDIMVVLIKGEDRPDSRAPGRLAARIDVVACPPSVASGAVFEARVRVRNVGDTTWLALPDDPARLGADHRPRMHPDVRGRAEPVDYDAAFLDKAIEGASFANREPVGRYRAYLERHALEGMVAMGVRLLAVDGDHAVDADYGRGFLPHDLEPGDEADVAVRMRAPVTPGFYRLVFDAVDEYVAWFEDVGSEAAHEILRVEGAGVPPDSRAPHVLCGSLSLREGPAGGPPIVRATNTGDTVWLAGPLSRPGEVKLGLQALGPDGAVAKRDWHRLPLPRCVWPGEHVDLVLDAADCPEALRVDLVAEGVCWFEERGGATLSIRMR